MNGEMSDEINDEINDEMKKNRKNSAFLLSITRYRWFELNALAVMSCFIFRVH